MKTKPLPLMMADKVIGRVTLDYDTNKIEGTLDPNIIKLLEESMGAGLLEISFFGKPSFPADPASIQKKLYDYINDGK